jgi:outer membrane protein insertion porin family
LVPVFCLVFIFSAFAQESGEWYQGKPIKDIVFSGLQNVKRAELEGVVNPFIGRLFNDEVFWELQGQLYALEYFEVINPSAVPADPSGNEVIIRFAVTERPMVSRINFIGNSRLRRAELLSVISIKVNDVANQIKLKADELAVINKYLESGYPDVKVRSETRPNTNGTITITFFVTEGERITIDEFRFEGNSVFSNRTLRGRLSLKTKSLINAGAFQEAKLIADREAITQYYHDRGYIDAEIIDVVREVKKDARGNNALTLTFRIYEGRKYTFGGVSFEGNKIFPTEQLEGLIRSKVGETLNAGRLEADLQRVADLYFENGYIFNSIGREEIRDAAAGVISFLVPIVERGRAHIERILVRGNEKTKDHVILREIPLEPGDVFSKTKVMDGLRNLYNLQYFSTVVPETPPGSTDSLMDLVITVEEQHTTDVQFGITFSGSSDPDTFPISGMVKWTDRNFLGYGNTVGAEVNASPDVQRLALEYTQRWIFGLPLSGGFDISFQHAQRVAAMDNTAPFFNGDEEYAFPDGFESYIEYEDANKEPPSGYLMTYDQWSISLGFSTGYRWLTALGGLGLGGGVRTGFVLNLYDNDLFRPFDLTLRNKNNSWLPMNSTWISLSLDQRDVYYDPSRGYYGMQRLGLVGFAPVEREHYMKSETKAEYYYTLFNIPITEKYSFKSILAFHTGVSFILRQPFYDKPIIEDANKLVIDGMFIGRGWTDERLNRGLALWENWAEIRFPIVPGILALDGFFDAAAVKSTPQQFFNHFAIEDMRFSLGGGLRFAIPQFPFRFSLAKRFKISDGKIDWQGGNIWKGGDPNSGVDFVISFALATY